MNFVPFLPFMSLLNAVFPLMSLQEKWLVIHVLKLLVKSFYVHPESYIPGFCI